MKKYYLAETEEEIQFDDMITISCVKSTEDGTVTVEKNIKFTPDNVESLIDMEVIYEQDEEDEEEEFTCEPLEDLMVSYEELEGRVEKLEELVHGLCGDMVSVTKIVHKLMDKQKTTAQPKKKE